MAENQDSAPEMDDLRLAFNLDGYELGDLPLEEGAILDGPIPDPTPDAAKPKKPRPTVQLEASGGLKVRKARNPERKVDPNPYNWSIFGQVDRKQACAEERGKRKGRERDPIDEEWGIPRSEVAAQRRQLARFQRQDKCMCLGKGTADFICTCLQVPEAPSSMGVSLAGAHIDLGDLPEKLGPNCCICLTNDCLGGSNKFKCVDCGSGCCEEVARQGLGTEWCLKCPNCGGELTAFGKAKKKAKEIKTKAKQLQVQDEVQRELAGNGYFGKCPCGDDYFYEKDSAPTVKCSSCFADIVLFTPPAPEHWDALSDNFAFHKIYGGECPECNDKVTRTPAYEILACGKFSRDQTGGCASTLHDKCGTTMCIGGNPNCRAFLKSVSNPEEVHHVTEHFCRCYGQLLNFNGTCSACHKCRLYCAVEHWACIFVKAKVEWYTKNNLIVPVNLLNEIRYFKGMENIYAYAY